MIYRIREHIIDHFLNEENADDVIIDTTIDEAKELHLTAQEFYNQLVEFQSVWNALPKDKPWEVNEMFLLIPQLMKIYIQAMKLPYPEYMEDEDSEISDMFHGQRVNFSKEYDSYWQVFDPYCEGDLYENPDDRESGIVKGALWDDLADILTDLAEGAGAFETGLVCKAIFNWKYSFVSHYGHHIRNAVTAMGAAWEKEERNRDR